MNPFQVAIQRLTRIMQGNTHLPRHSLTYTPLPNTCPGIILYYPGRKNGGLDYKLELDNQIVYHSDIAQVIYNLSLNGYSQEIINFLIDIYQNGLAANHNRNIPQPIHILASTLTLKQFKQLIFFTTLQEDINYPQPRFLGTRMPFYRFIEASVAAVQPEILSYQNVIARINIRNQRPPAGLVHNQLHRYFVNAINQI